MPLNAIVVGMPRSGTSLAASVFARKGYYLGRIDLAYKREGDDHNPFGYFEADQLVDGSIEALHQVGYPFQDTWRFERISPEIVARIAALEPRESHRRLVQDFEQHAPWVWKDPRLCYTLPYWWKMVEPARTRVLLIRRDPLQIYRSFCRMDWCVPGSDEARHAVLERVEEHLCAATRAIEALGIPYLAVDYRDYGERPDQVADRLSQFFELELRPQDLQFRAELNHSTRRGRIAAYLRNKLKRLPRKPVRTLERLVPRRILALVFPERKYTDDHAAKSRENKH